MRPINSIIVHCSDSDSPAYGFQEIEDDHIKRGFKEIGYHIGIDYDGNVHYLRQIGRPGAHCKSHNTKSIGICLLGKKHFSEKQIQTLITVINHYATIFCLTMPDIYGHYELDKGKTCPNIDIHKFKQENFIKLMDCHVKGGIKWQEE